MSLGTNKEKYAIQAIAFTLQSHDNKYDIKSLARTDKTKHNAIRLKSTHRHCAIDIC